MGKHSHDIPWKKYKEILDFDDSAEKQFVKDKSKSELEYSVLLEENILYIYMLIMKIFL